MLIRAQCFALRVSPVRQRHSSSRGICLAAINIFLNGELAKASSRRARERGVCLAGKRDEQSSHCDLSEGKFSAEVGAGLRIHLPLAKCRVSCVWSSEVSERNLVPSTTRRSFELFNRKPDCRHAACSAYLLRKGAHLYPSERVGWLNEPTLCALTCCASV